MRPHLILFKNILKEKSKMEKQAGELLGEAVLAGVSLDSQAAVKKALKGSGELGKLFGNALAGVDLKEATAPGNHTGSCFMAVSQNKIGFYGVKQGLFKNSLGETLAEHPRSDVKALEVEAGMMSTVHIVLQDGTHYVLLCPKFNQKALKKVQELFA